MVDKHPRGFFSQAAGSNLFKIRNKDKAQRHSLKLKEGVARSRCFRLGAGWLEGTADPPTTTTAPGPRAKKTPPAPACAAPGSREPAPRSRPRLRAAAAGLMAGSAAPHRHLLGEAAPGDPAPLNPADRRQGRPPPRKGWKNEQRALARCWR